MITNNDLQPASGGNWPPAGDGKTEHQRRHGLNGCRLYISGPMRGIPQYNFPEFDSLAAWLELKGYDVISPADHDREVDPGMENTEAYRVGVDTENVLELLAWDLATIASPDCHGIVLLPGWSDSVGAKHERYVAEATGKQVWLANRMGMSQEWYMTLDNSREMGAGQRAADSLQPTPTPVMEAVNTLPWTYDQANGPVMQRLRDQQQKYARSDELPMKDRFQTKDSGSRIEFHSGMVRDTQEGKPRYDLIPLLPLRRLADLYTRGAEKYSDRNWEKANSVEELERMKASLLRHLFQALAGETDEDHWSAVSWNAFGIVWLEDKLLGAVVPPDRENG